MDAFRPQGGTFRVALTSVGSAGVQITTGSIQGCIVSNMSTDNAYVWFSQTSAAMVATSLWTTAAIIAAIPVMQKSQRTYAIPPNSFVTGITTGASIAVTLDIAPGYGNY